MNFFKLESASGIVLFLAALLAIILENSPLSGLYQAIFKAPFFMAKPMLFWINEGFMSAFFLLVGLELKRELIQGELSSVSKIALPSIAALGGMLIPAFFYAILNTGNTTALKGWSIPVATDIAFALGVLSLFGKRVPTSLRAFLLALAIVDDIGAILIIAFFHSHDLSVIFLVLSSIALLSLVILNFLGVRKLLPYLLMGFVLWICILQSGIHATIAGVLLAFCIPVSKKISSSSPLLYLERALHPWVAFGIMPLFALANAGMSFSGTPRETLFNPIVLGIIAGLCLGKQSGVFGFSWLMVRLGWATRPEQTTWLQLYGVSLLCGIGFTMSLFLGTLAFHDAQAMHLMSVRQGVLLGSLISGILGAVVLQIAFLKRR